jgi:hypothetical protein
MRKIFFIILLGLSVTNCVNVGKQMDTWMGHTKQSLIMAQGAPDRTYEMDDGSEMLIWEVRQINYATSQSTKICDMEFHIGTNKKVIGWRNNCGVLPLI